MANVYFDYDVGSDVFLADQKSKTIKMPGKRYIHWFGLVHSLINFSLKYVYKFAMYILE